VASTPWDAEFYTVIRKMTLLKSTSNHGKISTTLTVNNVATRCITWTLTDHDRACWIMD
jgi:hypothetical protein